MTIFGKTHRPLPIALHHSSLIWFPVQTLANYAGQTPLELVSNFLHFAGDYALIATPVTSINFPKHLILEAIQEMTKALPASEIYITADWGYQILGFFDYMDTIEQEEIERRKINHAKSLQLSLALGRDGWVIIPSSYTRIGDRRPHTFIRAIEDGDGEICTYIVVDTSMWDVLEVPYDLKKETFTVSYSERLKVHEADGWKIVVGDAPWPDGSSFMIRAKRE